MSRPFQQTLSGSAELTGVGLHSGENVQIGFRPAPPGHGIIFRRSDLSGEPTIPAHVEWVVGVERGTVLGRGEARVRTVEHVLAALSALGIDNVLIDLDAEEPPAGDGSAEPFLELLRGVGLEEQSERARTWACTTPFTVRAADARYAVVPDDRFVISSTIEFDHPLIGRQSASHVIEPESFAREVASARTFGFIEDARSLRAAGLARGADLQNTVVLTPDGLHEGVDLRYPDEFVRHKILDLVGDLLLTGRRIQAHVIAERPGHSGNVQLARAVASRIGQSETGPVLDVTQILEILPHRFPFLLVDRVIEYEQGKRIVGIKNVTIDEPFFVGHFPGLPIMPGVLIIEAMAQVGGLLLMDVVEDRENKVVYFMSLDNVKFRRPVTPGDQIVFELELLQLRQTTCRMKGVGRVDGNVVAEAEMMARVMDR